MHLTPDPALSSGVAGDSIAAAVAPARCAAVAAIQHESTDVSDAIAWLSAHIGAVEQVVHPVVRRHLSDGASRLAAQRGVDHELKTVLRLIERHHSGDVQVALVEHDAREVLLRRALEHAEHEEVILRAVDRSLTAQERRLLVIRYQRALRDAPTRPHPHLPNHGPLRSLGYRLSRIRDRALDVMDSRSVPVPRRARTTVPTGKWGLFLLGGGEGFARAQAPAADTMASVPKPRRIPSSKP
jgi:hypothetical protein